MTIPEPPHEWKVPSNRTRLLPLVVERLHHAGFFFVNIGANDGVTSDPIYPFLKKYGWHGLAVEPLDYVCDKLRRNYADFEGVVIEQAAVTSKPRPFFYIAQDATDASFISQIGSMHSEYIEKTIALLREHEFDGPVRADLESYIRKVDVPCLTFEQLLTKHAVQHIDFLNIDAEKSDFDILMMIDFTRWRPNILCLETSEFQEEERGQVREVLRVAGYEFLEQSDPFSSLFVQSEHIARA